METAFKTKSPKPLQVSIKEAVKKAQEFLLSRQSAEGYWCFPTEVDGTLTAEYLILRRFLGIWDSDIAQKGARYLWSLQNSEGGWGLYYGSPSNISSTVKAYFALKLCGFSTEDPRLIKARKVIHHLGGVEACNVFTKYQLALFGQFPWEGAPAMPLEIFKIPNRFYFSMYNISYWSRTVLIPLLVLFHFKPLSVLPKSMQLDELYLNPKNKKSFRMKRSRPLFSLKNIFLLIDKGLQLYEKWPWKPWRKHILKQIENWLLAHTDRKGGLGAIYPAIANSVLALKLLGYSFEEPPVQNQWKEIEKLVHFRTDYKDFFVQPCNSPIWDTALSVLALIESGMEPDHPKIQKAGCWLVSKQSQVEGDWKVKTPKAKGKGWYFQFYNEYYPDADDTAIVLYALDKIKFSSQNRNVVMQAKHEGLLWLESMRSSDGGWGAFDKDNDHIKLNLIPFADHGSLLDPSTADVTSRALTALSSSKKSENSKLIEQGLSYLLQVQELNGSWFGRWGANYIYGTWSALTALKANGFHPNHSAVKKANDWLHLVQNRDGGWGESLASYESAEFHGRGDSTASQTAWGLMGLLASGETFESPAVEKGARFLIEQQLSDGSWKERQFTGTGFPKVFYLKYHGYPVYFPLMALSNLKKYDYPYL